VLQKHCTKPVSPEGLSAGCATVRHRERVFRLCEGVHCGADRGVAGGCAEGLRAGDTLVVWRLNRLGRSLPHLIETIGELQPMAAVWVFYLHLRKYCV